MGEPAFADHYGRVRLRDFLPTASVLGESAFAARYGRVAVVAGASEGIGAAFATALAARGLDLVLIARRREPLEQLALQLTAQHPVQVTTLTLDLGDGAACEHIAAATADFDVGLLIYNACASRIGVFDAEASDDAIVAVNCRGLARLAHVFAPRLAARGRGGLLLMSSMSGFHGHALAATYCASKAFTTALGEALWAEYEPRGVAVRVVAAGATKTPSFLSATPPATRSLALPMESDAVAAFALRSLERSGGPVVVPGLLNRLAAAAMRRLLSRGMASRFMSFNLRRVYRAAAAEEAAAVVAAAAAAARGGAASPSGLRGTLSSPLTMLLAFALSGMLAAWHWPPEK